MLETAFLISALAVSPGLSFQSDASPAIHRAVTASAEFVSYVTKRKGKALLVGGDPILVIQFRKRGIKAFGVLTDDQPGTTLWHVVGDGPRLPIKPGAFQFVYWMQNNPLREISLLALRQGVGSVTNGGFFIFDDREYEHWSRWLVGHGWERLPFRAGPYMIWQKPKGPGKILQYIKPLLSSA